MRQRGRIGIGSLLVTLLVMAAVAGAGAVSPPTAGASAKHVTITNMTFTPRAITVKAGTKVTWKNNDGVIHNVTSASSIKTTATVTGLFASASLGKGKTFSFTFKKKGTFFYECTIHAAMASMHGKVVVR
jgi:plastocyanin